MKLSGFSLHEMTDDGRHSACGLSQLQVLCVKFLCVSSCVCVIMCVCHCVCVVSPTITMYSIYDV